MSVTVSVVLPTYQRAELLDRALASVVEQTVAATEIVVVDDGSTDDTHSVVDRWATEVVRREAGPALRYLFQPNSGPSRARNLGVAMATGTWIAFLDSDDEWKREKLGRQLQAAAARPELRLWHSDEIWIRRGNQVLQRKKHRKRGGWIYRDCLELCVVSPSATLLEKSLFVEVGGFDESLPACEDYDLWLRICSRYEVGFVEEPLLVKHGGHEDQLSQRFEAMDRFRVRALAKALDELDLDDEQRRDTLVKLFDKLRILRAGAEKRGLTERLAEVDEIAGRWSAEHELLAAESTGG